MNDGIGFTHIVPERRYRARHNIIVAPQIPIPLVKVLAGVRKPDYFSGLLINGDIETANTFDHFVNQPFLFLSLSILYYILYYGVSNNDA